MPVFAPAGKIDIDGWEACRTADLNGDGAIDVIVDGQYIRNKNPNGWPFQPSMAVKLDAGRRPCFLDIDGDCRLDAVCLRGGKTVQPDFYRIGWRRNLGGNLPRFGEERDLPDIDVPLCTMVSAYRDGEESGLIVQHDAFQQISFYALDDVSESEPDLPKFRRRGRAESISAVLSLSDQAWPCLCDWDSDGDLDLLVGGGYGWPRIVINKGTRESPVYAEPQLILSQGQPIRFVRNEILGAPANWHDMGYPFPVFVDWDNDGLTALSYAELSSRFPRSGGESYFCHQAFQSPVVAILIGWLVFCSGTVSMAAVSHAFSGYLLGLFPGVHPGATYAVVAAFLLVISGINFWGIQQSSKANIVCTCIETSGLLLVIVVGLRFLANDPVTTSPEPVVVESTGESCWLIAQAAALAFFAFIGFEDMVNVAEEVESPQRNMPAAILTALVITGCVYVAVVFIATSVVPPTELAGSDAPLLKVVQHAAPGFPLWLFTLIALFAVTNTALLNCIMGSRLLFGMSEQHLLPRVLGRIHPRTQTPHWAIVTIFIAATALAWSGTLVYLAGTTSVLLLIVFSAVILSLVVVKRRQAETSGIFRVPLVIPVLGGLSSLALITGLPRASLLLSLGIIVAGLLVILIGRVRHPSAE